MLGKDMVVLPLSGVVTKVFKRTKGRVYENVDPVLEDIKCLRQLCNGTHSREIMWYKCGESVYKAQVEGVTYFLSNSQDGNLLTVEVNGRVRRLIRGYSLFDALWRAVTFYYESSVSCNLSELERDYVETLKKDTVSGKLAWVYIDDFYRAVVSEKVVVNLYSSPEYVLYVGIPGAEFRILQDNELLSELWLTIVNSGGSIVEAYMRNVVDGEDE